MRCFVGIPLPDGTRDALAAACRGLREADVGWRVEKWVPAENLHITLAFLGDVGPDSIPVLCEALGREYAESRRFELALDRLSPVPDTRRARMLWASYTDPEGACDALASSTARAAVQSGIAIDERPFHAHVTLARARRPHGVGKALRDALSSACDGLPAFVSVASATLFSSTLTPAGPRYEVLKTWRFPR